MAFHPGTRLQSDLHNPKAFAFVCRPPTPGVYVPPNLRSGAVTKEDPLKTTVKSLLNKLSAGNLQLIVEKLLALYNGMSPRATAGLLTDSRRAQGFILSSV